MTMSSQRRPPTVSPAVRAWLMWLSVLGLPGMAAAQDCGGCTSPGVVAVASILSTLAVVALLLGLGYFWLRRKNGGFLFPVKRTRKSNGRAEEGGTGHNARDSSHHNLAFTADGLEAEEGRANQSPKKNSSPVKKSPTRKEEQKTWVSFPGQGEVPEGLNRQGSCGSLDAGSVEPEQVSVWLQSQDIIGLGFNISGNMRDGIFVSQVHNRGPAVESGKIKVGDRIMSVTIAYENIVYEDALTILSYASPYPVQVRVQKEPTAGSQRGPGRTEQLNHPLFRSQSLDALQRITKDPVLRPKRTHSEMKVHTHADSPRKKPGDRRSKGLSQSMYMPAQDHFELNSEVELHATQENDDWGFPPLPIQPIDMKGVSSSPPADSGKMGQEAEGVNSESAFQFANLMDQMLDGVGEGSGESQGEASLNTSPRTPPSKPQRKKKSSNSSLASLEDTFQSGSDFLDQAQPRMQESGADIFKAASDVTAQAPPKAREMGAEIGEDIFQAASSATAQTLPRALAKEAGAEIKEDIFEAASALKAQALPRAQEKGVEIKEEIFQAASAVKAHALPRAEEPGTEVEEEEIKPAFVKREVIVGSSDIQFTPRQTSQPEERQPISDSFVDITMSEITRRSSSPEREEVEEDMIQPAVASRDTSAAPLPSSAREDHSSPSKGEKKKKKEKAPKAPALDEKELDRLIAMNTFAPGSQGWAGIQAGGTQGGVLDDFIPVAQQVLPGPAQATPLAAANSRAPKGGVAFEVRDDVLTGRPVSVDISKSRNSSRGPSRSNSEDRMGQFSSPWDSQLTPLSSDNPKQEASLDWSGKRLIHAGSFSDIPHVDSISDWTDSNRLNEDDNSSPAVDTNSEDCETEPSDLLTAVSAWQGPVTASDTPHSLSSSGSSSPPLLNGPLEGEGSGGRGGTKSGGLMIESLTGPLIDLSPTPDSNANSKTFTFTLDSNLEEDC